MTRNSVVVKAMNQRMVVAKSPRTRPEAHPQGVVSGLGASFVPKSAIQQQEEEGLLRSFSIPSGAVYTKTYFIRHKDVFVTSALDQFLELLRGTSLYDQK